MTACCIRQSFGVVQGFVIAAVCGFQLCTGQRMMKARRSFIGNIMSVLMLLSKARAACQRRGILIGGHGCAALALSTARKSATRHVVTLSENFIGLGNVPAATRRQTVAEEMPKRDSTVGSLTWAESGRVSQKRSASGILVLLFCAISHHYLSWCSAKYWLPFAEESNRKLTK
jgi:hypothetical protein